jgi:hypothetical protein
MKLYSIKPLNWQPRGDTFFATACGIEFITAPMGVGWSLSYSPETSLFRIWHATIEEAKEKAETMREEKLLDELLEVPEALLWATRKPKSK